MKMFATALKGRRVVTIEGEELGDIDTVVVNSELPLPKSLFMILE